tara:strand:- start:50 stop:1597 length:1548 start_codon:yes stop_codon:yes gene_type:complete
MARLAGLLLFVLLSACSQGPAVVTDNGTRLVGLTDEATGVAAFLGVPYAKAPVGALRWAAPQALPQGDARIDATQFAPACMQDMRILDWYRDLAEAFGAPRTAYEDLQVAEDCLYLNIWTPAPAGGEDLPVMVYVHGGSNNSGWSYEPPYRGQHLAAEGAVVVTIAYRLGVFGFFSHPELTGEAVANFGLWDQLAALRWIQENIHHFGGDPERVLLFGESAGAEDILALLYSDAADGLVARAALQSPAGFGIDQASLAEERHRGATLTAALGLDGDNTLPHLRDLPAADLLAAYNEVFSDYYHSPVIDGELLRRSTWDAVHSAEQMDVPLIVGTNADEWLEWVEENPEHSDLALRAAQLRHIDPSLALDVLAEENSLREALERLSTAEEMLCPAQHVAANVSRQGGKAWAYYFTRVRDGEAGARLGAFHGAEYTYIFATNYAGMPATPVDQGLQKAMQAYWLEFARKGDPNAGKLPAWPEFSAPTYAVQELGDAVQSIARPESLLCASFDASQEF